MARNNDIYQTAEEFDWRSYLEKSSGRILELDALPAEVREAVAAGSEVFSEYGYRVDVAATRPELLSGRQLLFWSDEEWRGEKAEREKNAVPLPQTPSGDANLSFGDAAKYYDLWPRPTVIVADGPYGLGSFPGDPHTPDGLADWFRPHAEKWYARALPSATLWFWNSEQGWANCHRMLEDAGWEFRNCHIWDKGISHIAGNCNTKTIRKYPVVTEVCVQYVRKNYLKSGENRLPIREWLRAEWSRCGLPFKQTNVACGVTDAATRKYFSKDHLWYFPPAEAFVKIARFANAHGRPTEKPYFAKDDGTPFTAEEWELMRAKFKCEIGVSNVWHENAVRGSERIKVGSSCLHMNQKPLSMMTRIIESSSDPGDVVWEPFGGLCSAAVAALRQRRRAFAAEVNEVFFKEALERIANEKDVLR